MNANDTFRNSNEVKAGDILLCYKDPEANIVAGKIKEATGSEYCHAAIYCEEGFVAESIAMDGLKKGKIVKNKIDEMISRYDHIAVLRQPDAWCSPTSVNALKLFVNKVIDTGAKYNFSAVFNFKNRKQLHETNVHQKLEEYFNNNLQPASANKDKYFCSEFVADCFIATGFIHPSAAILYQSDTYAPGDLGKEPTFGTFWGYLTNKHDYKVKETDYYYHATTYEQIFGV